MFRKVKDDNKNKVNMEDVNHLDNISQDDNIYGEYTHTTNEDNVNNEVDDSTDNNINSNDNNIDANENKHNVQDEKESEVIPEKEKNNNTKARIANKASKLFLVGFYLVVIIVGAVAFFMIRSNKYEFYLKQNSVLIDSGSTYQIELIPKDARYFDYLNYDYSVADESIATVDEYGTVTTTGSGTTTLKISLKPGFINSKTMTIVSENIDVESVDIGVSQDDTFVVADYIDVAVDQSVTLKTILNNRDDLNVSSSFTSSNPTVASVDSFGNVTAKKPGTAVITSEVNGAEGSITINVLEEEKPKIIKPVTKSTRTSTPKPSKPTETITPPEPTDEPPIVIEPTVTPIITLTPTPKVITKISFQSNSTSIKKGSTMQLAAIITPTELSNSSITWTSSDKNIVSVNNKGVITGVNVGKAIVKATTENGLVASCEVSVKTDEIPVTKVSLNKTDVSIEVGSKYQLISTIEPSTATVRKLTWSSDNSKAVTVDQNGLLIAKSVGKATVTVTSSDGKKTAKCTVTVNSAPTPTPSPTPKPTPKVTATAKVTPKVTATAKVTPKVAATAKPKVTKVSLGVASQITKYVGEELKLAAAVEPSSITDYTVKWSCNDTSKATVKNGTVKLISAGTVEITAEVDGVKAKVTIVIKNKTVNPPTGASFTGKVAKYLTVDKTTLTINKGSTAKFKIKLSKAVGSIFVSSKDNKIASITYPTGGVDICNSALNPPMCFMDAYTSDNEIEFTVNGVKEGTTYIIIDIDSILISVDANTEEEVTKGTAKIGILVK